MNPLIKQHKLRKALGICNRLKAGPTKVRHVSRIMGALNRVRAAAKKCDAIDRAEFHLYQAAIKLERLNKVLGQC